MMTGKTSFVGHLGHYWILGFDQTAVGLSEVVDPRGKLEQHFGT